MDKFDIAIKLIVTITLAVFFIGMLELANDVSNQRIELNYLKQRINTIAGEQNEFK